MDRSRYEGYVAAKDAVSAQVTDPFAAEVLSDLGEGLLLSRDDAEARQAQAQVIEAFGLLVDRGDLAGNIAGRLWVHLRACGPEMHWPPTWDRVRAAPIGPAMRGH
jgi:hypothetical protein